MAKSDMREFNEAEKYLQQGYTEAKNYERRTGATYNRNQLDDRKAKFLMLRGQHVERAAMNLYHDMVEASRIVARLLRQENITHHPFQTLQVIAETFMSKKEELLEPHRDPIQRMVDDLIQQARGCLKNVPQGYQQRRATEALNDVTAFTPPIAGRT